MIRGSLLCVIALVLVNLSTTNAEAETIDLGDPPFAYSKADVEKAIAVFRKNCTPLGSIYWEDIESYSAEVRQEFAPHRLSKGWVHTITLKVKIPQNPKIIPKQHQNAGVIAGHTLYFDIGGGEEPGYFAGKRASQLLCGLPVNQEGRDVFKSVPYFEYLQR